MPGIVVFRRRWSVGSDDLVVPGAFLFTVHFIWAIVLTVLLAIIHFDHSVQCVQLLWGFIIGYLAVLGLSLATEVWICVVAMRGSILDTAPRSSMQYILYTRLGIMIIEAGWLSAGVTWLIKFYVDCPIDNAKETVLGLVVCNWSILVSVLITVWCTYDSAGRSWVKMKQYQRSMRESESKFQYKRSGSTRNWRQRKVIRAYQDSWQQRCRFLFCCARPSDRNRNSFADIARLLSDFFRDLDVVPSDVVAGLVLLRKFQKIERKAIVEQRKNDTYEFLSGVAITPRTQFLSLHENADDLELFQTVIHYAHYAVRVYGWPIYVMTSKLGLCRICPDLSCCVCLTCRKISADVEVVDDNCCRCNYAVLQKLNDIGDIEIIYVTYHVDVGETPFFVALDYDRKKVVISIRGTLSMQDILTDLNAEGETLPLDPPREDWLGHKGMVQAAQYILEKLKAENLIEQALNHCPERGTNDFQLVLVGHSLGAGTASILGILLRQEYTDLQCYCYSPPGGLLSMPAVEYTKSFTISVVMGKDVVPRIGLHQMEALRADLINAIKRSVDPKWKTIACSVVCCGCYSEPTSAVELSTGETNVAEYMRSKDYARCVGVHPSDSSIALTSHQPLYPPGRIIHVVRHHPTRGEQALSSHDPVYQALWAENTDFDEVLISPVMIQDHMPDKVLEALNKVERSGVRRHHIVASPIDHKPPPPDTRDSFAIKTRLCPFNVVTTLGPRKPQRSTSKPHDEPVLLPPASPTPPPHRLFLETSFTSLASPSGATSNASSITNGYYSTRSQPSPLQITDVFAMLNTRTRSTPKFPVNVQIDVPKKSLSLNLTNKPVDLIHDDWFGLAPLASPESLSEVSSISSRTSFTTNLEKSVSYELRTPKIMRRTPKISTNLSTCADDIKNVRYFQKVTQGARFVRKTSQNGSSISSSNLSFESATSSKCCSHDNPDSTSRCCSGIEEESETKNIATSDEFQSAEDILENVIASAGCAEYFNAKTPTYLETHFDDYFEVPVAKIAPIRKPTSPRFISPTTTPQDPDIISNLAIDLMDEEHHQRSALQTGSSSSKPNSLDSVSVCRTPSDTKNVTFNPQVINIDVSEPASDTSPCCRTGKKSDRWHLLPLRKPKREHVCVRPIAKVEQIVPKTILCSKRRNSEDDFFSRTEALPLLSGLNVVEKTSPNFVRRKKYVYPAITVVSKGESSV